MFLYALVHVFLLPETWARQSLEDSGLISIITMILIGITLFILVAWSRQAGGTPYRTAIYCLTYLVLIYLLREADFHRLFTDEHVTRGTFYTDPQIDIRQKLLGGIPMLLFFICFFTYW